MEYSGEGVLYVCMHSRDLRASGATGLPSKKSDSLTAETISQLFQQMRGMCTLLTDLTTQVNTLSSFQPNPSPNAENTEQQCRAANTGAAGQALLRAEDPPGILSFSDPQGTQSSSEYRAVVRQELRELQKRDKHRESVIVHGLEASSPAVLVTRFAELTENNMGKRVELTEVRAIPSHPDLYRAKILNAGDRKLVLDIAKNLHGTRHDKVFIRRDLTFAQRAELRETPEQAGQYWKPYTTTGRC